jgi:hypothetical protein
MVHQTRESLWSEQLESTDVKLAHSVARMRALLDAVIDIAARPCRAWWLWAYHLAVYRLGIGFAAISVTGYRLNC